MYKVYYLMHSSFLVELADRYLLFDYFNKEVVSETVEFRGGLPQLDLEKQLGKRFRGSGKHHQP